jgi:hypothetical protein
MKKNLFGLLAIAIAILSVAFTAPKTAPGVYFKFNGVITNPSDVANENLWDKTELDECEAGNRACFIEADEDPSNLGHPKMVYVQSSDNLQPKTDISTTGAKVYTVFNRIP